jgi:hypothetical protein
MPEALAHRIYEVRDAKTPGTAIEFLVVHSVVLRP